MGRVLTGRRRRELTELQSFAGVTGGTVAFWGVQQTKDELRSLAYEKPLTPKDITNAHTQALRYDVGFEIAGYAVFDDERREKTARQLGLEFNPDGGTNTDVGAKMAMAYYASLPTDGSIPF